MAGSISSLGAASALLIALCAGVAQAQDNPPEPPAEQPVPESHNDTPRTPSRWQLRLEPSIWYMGVGGELKMPGTPANVEKIDVDDLGFDSPRLTPHAQAELRLDDLWRISLRGFAFSGDRDAQLGSATQIGTIAFNAGDTVSASLDYTSIEAQVGYTFHRYTSAGATSDGRPDLTFDAEAFAGLRAIDLDWRISRVGGGSQQSDNLYLEPIVGAQAMLRFNERFGVRLLVDVGGMPLGDTSSFTGDVLAGFTYEPTPNIGVQIGYRSAFFSLSDGDGADEFEYDGAHQGLLFGLVLAF